MPAFRSVAHFWMVGLALLPLLASGCGWDQARFTKTTNDARSHVSGSGVKVTTRNGSITVRQATDATEVTIQATFRMVSDERLGQTSIVANRNASGVLEISATPPADGWRSNEGCSFDIALPDANGVELKSSNGKISLAGLNGKAKLDTSNGSITVTGHSGDIDAESSNGRVEATGVNGEVHIHTSNGAVQVHLAESAPGPVEIHTSNGGVTLELNAAFRGRLTIDTSNGSIRLPDSTPQGLTVQSYATKGHATFKVGDSGAQSTIETGNGGVTVRYAN